MRRIILIIVFMLAIVPVSSATQITFKSLLNEMTDLEALATPDNPEFTCGQFSSYDRRSTDPKALTDENWFANGDAGNFLREETRNGAVERVMVDVDGPGAIVRMWSANPDAAGILRVYLDHSETPTIEMPFIELLSGETAPFIAPIAGERSRGWNSHLPIPYAKHCKITSSGQGFYYIVNYRTYPEGTSVRSFTLKQANKQIKWIRAQADQLAAPAVFDTEQKGLTSTSYQLVLPSGASVERTLAGPAAIRRLTALPQTDDMETALRGCLLEITFDDAATPQVSVPLGDFFGAAPGLNPFEALPCGVMDKGLMYSHWVMPFYEQVQFRLTNFSGADLSLHGNVITSPWKKRQPLLYFHTNWRRGEQVSTDPRQDWNYLTAEGSGKFVGVMLHVTNPVSGWWGEGDEKVYVDGETFPSHFGTGSEDYFGYAWCSNEPFVHAYHNQPRCDGPGNYGQTCVNRFHVLDTIPFTKAFKFDMEIWHWVPTEIDYATTAYWYGAPGARAIMPAIDPALLRVRHVPEVTALPGAIEGESLSPANANVSGVATKFARVEIGASDGYVLIWGGGKVGEQLSLYFPVDEAGVYDVKGRFATGKGRGAFQFSINGQPVGKKHNFFRNDDDSIIELDFGRHQLKAGDNTISAELMATQKDQKFGGLFELDCLFLEKK